MNTIFQYKLERKALTQIKMRVGQIISVAAIADDAFVFVMADGRPGAKTSTRSFAVIQTGSGAEVEGGTALFFLGSVVLKGEAFHIFETEKV